jgi:hypothetical protein
MKDNNAQVCAEIYDHFSKINVNQWLTKKGKFLYLSWMACWMLIKEFDPAARFWFGSHNGKGAARFIASGDGDSLSYTAEITSFIEVKGITFEMHLPCMDHLNKAVVNPDARCINDNKMRGMVKNAAVNLGLGGYVFLGEKAPRKQKLSMDLENGTSQTSTDALFAPTTHQSGNSTPTNGMSQKFVATATDAVSDAVVSPDLNEDDVIGYNVGDDVVLIGYGAKDNKTYSQVYGSDVKSLDSQIQWCKENGKGDKANQHLANLVQYRLMLTASV